VIIVQHKNVLSLCSFDRRISTNAHTDVVLIKIDDVAILGGLWITLAVTFLWDSVVDDNNVRLINVFANRLNEPVAGPWPVDRFNAEGDVSGGD
jgi:hypothetical protein